MRAKEISEPEVIRVSVAAHRDPRARLIRRADAIGVTWTIGALLLSFGIAACSIWTRSDLTPTEYALAEIDVIPPQANFTAFVERGCGDQRLTDALGRILQTILAQGAPVALIVVDPRSSVGHRTSPPRGADHSLIDYLERQRLASTAFSWVILNRDASEVERDFGEEESWLSRQIARHRAPKAMNVLLLRDGGCTKGGRLFQLAK